MPLVRPKKKRIKLLLIILANRVIALFDQNTEDSASEQLFDSIAMAKPALYGFDATESNWSQVQQDVWTAFEAIETALDPGGSGDVSESEIETLASNFDEAVARL